MVPPFLSSGALGSLKISRWSQPRSCSPSSSCWKLMWLRHPPTLRDPSPLSQGHWGKKNKDMGQKTSHQDHEVPPLHVLTLHEWGTLQLLHPLPYPCLHRGGSIRQRALPRGWDPTSAAGFMAKSRSSPLPELPKPLG